MQKFALMALAAALLITGCRQSNDQEQADEDGKIKLSPQEILVSVNGKSLTYEEAIRQVKLRLGGPPPPGMPDDQVHAIERNAFRNVIDSFIKRELLLAEAQNEGITADEAEINRRLDSIKQHSREGATPQGILTDGPAGTNSLRNEIVVGIMIDKLLAEKLPAIPPPDEAALQSFIEQNGGPPMLPPQATIQPITLPIPPDADSETKQQIQLRAEQLYEQVVAGADFEQVATTLGDSTAPPSVRNIKITKGRQHPAIDNAVFATEPGNIAPLIATPQAFMIARVIDQTPEHQASDEQILQAYMNRKQSENLMAYIRGLQEKADIMHSPAIDPIPSQAQPTPQ